MFSNKPNYVKLRTNLRLCINRLKLLEKKKTEMALKARREIADYIVAGKDDRARIRVEHIIREDYLVEAMEIVEMLCDLLLARFGLIEKMTELDPGIEEAIATLIWVTPRLSGDVQELREVSNQLTVKYGKEYAVMCLRNGFENVHEKVMHRMNVAAPPKRLVENYMAEIAKTYNVPFEPDPLVMMGPPPEAASLIDLERDCSGVNEGAFLGSGAGNGGGGASSGGNASSQKHLEAYGAAAYGAGAGNGENSEKRSSFGGAAASSGSPAGTSGASPKMPGGDAAGFGNSPPFGGTRVFPSEPRFPSPGSSGNNFIPPAGSVRPPPPLPNLPPNFYQDQQLPQYDDVMKSNTPNESPGSGNQSVPNGANGHFPVPAPRGVTPSSQNQIQPGQNNFPTLPDVPGLPSVPVNSVGVNSVAGDDVDFDDLTRRFEELKRKK